MYNPPQIVKNQDLPVVLIAGGAGFIGSHLSEYLLSQKFRVVVVDSLETGNRDYLAALTGHPRFAFFQHDLNSGVPEKIESVDYIIHLAGQEIHLGPGEQINMDSLLTNAFATNNLLELAKNSAATLLLTSSVNVYQGAISSVSLKNYFGASVEEEKTLSFFESKRFAEGLAFEYQKKYGLDVRVARLGEVYGPRMGLSATSNLGRFIGQALRGDNLTVFGDGLEKEYYGYISDTIDGLVKCLFKHGAAGAIYPITDLTPVTVLEQAYLVKSLALSGTQIVFKPKLNELEFPEFKVIDGQAQRQLKWKPKISLKDGIRLTLEYFGFSRERRAPGPRKSEETGERLTENYIPPGRFRKKEGGLFLKLPQFDLNSRLTKVNFLRHPRRKFAAVASLTFLTITLFLFMPIFQTFFYLGGAYFTVSQLKKDLNNLKFAAVVSDLEKIDAQILDGRRSLESAFLFRDEPTIRLLNSASFFAKAASAAAKGLKPLSDQIQQLAATPAGTVGANAEDLSGSRLAEGVENLSSAIDFLDLAQAEYKLTDKTKLPFWVKDRVNAYESFLKKSEKTFKTLSLALKAAPGLLGLEEEKNYLLIFQNSNELRPTGGFIGSIGRATVRNSRIENIKINDVYDVDGQIDERGIRVPQPSFLSDNLKTESLHLRDANYSPSFPGSARRIADLYTQATGETLDGVIAVDLFVLERLLRVTGPIFLSSYNETVSESNVFERTQFHAEASYFPGSSQKRTFLSILSQQLVDNLFSLEKSKRFEILKEADRLLSEKHLLLYFPDQQAILNQLGWDGEIRRSDNDYLMIVDSNVGSTKSNLFVERSVVYQLEKNNREGEYLASLRINYQHGGASNAWPGGPYKNHLRIFVPLKASLIKSFLSESGSEEEGEEVTGKTEAYEESGKTVFAATFTVATGQKTTFIINYTLPSSVVSEENRYRLLAQKQPGTKADGFKLRFAIPFGFDQDSLDQTFKIIGNTVEWSGFLATDQLIEIPLKH